MNKYNNPRLLNTVVSGTGMKNPVRPHVIIGSEKNGFIRGDLMDANAVKEAVEKEVAERIDADLNLSEEIDTKVRQAVDDLVDGAPEVLDTLKELSEALGDDANFATTITEEIASKVDKVEGKGLSTNDYTNAEKQKLAGIAAGAEVNVQSDWNVTSSSNDAFIKNKPTKLSLFTNDVPYTTQDYIINNFETKTRVTELKQSIKEKIDNIESVLPTTANRYEYVDLGLPSGTLWATCNVGANSPEEYGNYYMYGMGNKTYDAADTPYDGTEDPLDLSRDTARQVMGGSWHIPTREQMQELTDNTTYQWVTNYKGSGINGGTFTATNGAVLFLPAAGNWWSSIQYNEGSGGSYWSSSPNGSNRAYELNFYSDKVVNDNYRDCGFSVRGVINKEDVNKTFVPVASKDEVLTNEKVVAAALNDLTLRIANRYTDGEQIKLAGIEYGALKNVKADWNVTNSSSDAYIRNKPIVVTQSQITLQINQLHNTIDANIQDLTYVLAQAITTLNTKLHEANIKLEDINSELEDIDAIRLRTIFTPTPVDPNETVGIFAGSLTTDELEDLVTNTNTRKFLTTVRGNKTLIVGFVDFFTDWASHQITAVATSNIHLDEWDNKSDLTLVTHTDGKANVYVAYCGLHDPAGYSGLVEGEWTRWKKFNTDRDDLNEVTSSLKNREYMDSSTFDAIFTEADSDAIDWIIDNFTPTFYVKGPSDNVTTCSIVRSATAVCVTRNKVDNTTYTFINECRRGTIGSSGSINWSDWTTISSTVTPAPAA